MAGEERVWKDCPMHEKTDRCQANYPPDHPYWRHGDDKSQWKFPPCPTCAAHFAAVDAEREANAKACEKVGADWITCQAYGNYVTGDGERDCHWKNEAAQECAKAIRARKGGT